MIQSLRPLRIQSPPEARARVARDAIANASLPDPASDRAYAPTDCRREARQVAALQIVAAPAQQRVDDERVLDVDEHADRRIDARQRLDGEHGVKKAGAAAAVRFGNLDAHHAEPEQLVDERAGNRGVLVHLTDERPDLAVGELVDAVADQPFFLGERVSAGAGRHGCEG